MNVVNFGSNYQIYGENVKTYKELPALSYDVCFSKEMGFFLTQRPNLIPNEEKIYGSHEKKVRKVMNSFSAFNRNLGLILSGQKGIGKSLFARLLANEAHLQGYPVILVNSYIPGIDNFLATIEQEVVIIFDEFEKNFQKQDRDANHNPQDDMLSLFDGMNNGKKLFVITCNDANLLSSYLLNRPGRFHYHFTIGAPEANEIREYLTDKLAAEYYHYIDDVIRFSNISNVTYDLLRAIAFELNQGETFNDALQILNIRRNDNIFYDIIAYCSNGETYYGYHYCIDLLSKNTTCQAIGLTSMNFKDKKYIGIIFDIGNFTHEKDGGLRIEGSAVKPNIDEDDYWDMSEEQREKEMAKDRARQFDYIVLKRCDIYESKTFKAV